MLKRDPDHIIRYVLFWLEHASKAIQKMPSGLGGVSYWTTNNDSPGLTGWKYHVSKVYFYPSTLEERLLQRQVHEVMLTALAWALTQAETNVPKRWSAWNGMDLAEAYRIAGMVVAVDPLQAVACKIRLNNICLRMGITLKKLTDRTGIAW